MNTEKSASKPVMGAGITLSQVPLRSLLTEQEARELESSGLNVDNYSVGYTDALEDQEK